jgi:hypothetical protein
MASKAAKSGLALLGIGALLLLAGGAQASPTPAPKPAPLPPKPGDKCERTQPGDGKGNGKEAAVRAWQKCLVDSGCLAPDGIDGQHGPMTEAASKAYEANGGKCQSPVKPPGGGGSVATKQTSYRLVAQTAPGGVPKSEQLGAVELASPVKKADEKQVLSAFSGQADNYFGSTNEPGIALVYKNDGKGDKQVWQREYTQKALPPSGGSSVGGMIA